LRRGGRMAPRAVRQGVVRPRNDALAVPGPVPRAQGRGRAVRGNRLVAIEAVSRQAPDLGDRVRSHAAPGAKRKGPSVIDGGQRLRRRPNRVDALDRALQQTLNSPGARPARSLGSQLDPKDCADAGRGGKEISSEFVVAGGDAPPILDTTKKVFDFVPLPT